MCLLLCPLDTSHLKVGDVGPASTHSTEKCFLFLFTSNSWLSNQDYTQLWEIPTSNKAGIFMTRTFCCGLPLVCIVYVDCKVKRYWLEPNKGTGLRCQCLDHWTTYVSFYLFASYHQMCVYLPQSKMFWTMFQFWHMISVNITAIHMSKHQQ